METFYPFSFGLNNTNVAAFTKSDNSWIVGPNYFNAEGVTRYSYRKNEFQHIDFENSINLRSQSLYSILETDKEVWLGGNSAISIYNKKKDYWREISEANGLPNGKITSLAEDSSTIWVGTTKGLVKISKSNKRTEKIDLERLLRMRKINDLEIIGDNLWIATENYLLIYNQENNSLIDFKIFGNTGNIKERKNIFNKFTDLFQNDDAIYISTSVGILKYNIQNEYWTVIVEPSAYEGSKVNNLVILNGYCFIGVDYGVWQINIENGYSQLFDYPFIGSVQDMYIQGDILLIGSENGLIKYLWKKNS
jgi:ligand-binding sensor domain-containing protein